MLVTSMNRLKANCAHFAACVEAPIPEHNHEEQTLEWTLAPAWMALPEFTDARD